MQFTAVVSQPSAHLTSAPRAAVYNGCLEVSAEDSSLSNVEYDPAYTGIKCYRHYKMFYNFYGSYTYADDWVNSAIAGTDPGFLGRANNDNPTAGSAGPRRLADFTGVADDVRKAAAVTGSAFLATWMYVVREYEDAIDDCSEGTETARGCNENSADDAVGAWDEGVAFSTGSLEGKVGNSRNGSYGVGLYALAERRCIEFKT